MLRVLVRPSATERKAGRQPLGDDQEKLIVRHSAANGRSGIHRETNAHSDCLMDSIGPSNGRENEVRLFLP